MTRLREFLSDRWFDLLLWCRYDLSWRVVGFGVGVVAFPVLAAAVLVVRLPDGTSRMVVSSPVTLPIEEPAPLEVSPLRSRVEEVLVVGDSLVAGEEDIYREALASVGVSVRFDAAVSRGLRYGWLCPRTAHAAAEGMRMADDAGPGEFDEDLDGTGAEPGSGDGDATEGTTDAVSEDEDAATDADHGDDQGGDQGSVEEGLAEDVTDPSSAGCVRQGLEAISWYASSDGLSAAVVVALGTNDASSPARQVLERLDDLRLLLGSRQVFLMETVTDPMTSFHAGWNDTARTWCFADAACRFVEWSPSPAPSEFFGSDGVHLSALGSRVRADALAATLASGY